MSIHTSALNTALATALTHHDATGFRLFRDPQTSPDTPRLYAADVWLGTVHFETHAAPSADEAFAAAMAGLRATIGGAA